MSAGPACAVAGPQERPHGNPRPGAGRTARSCGPRPQLGPVLLLKADRMRLFTSEADPRPRSRRPYSLYRQLLSGETIKTGTRRVPVFVLHPAVYTHFPRVPVCFKFSLKSLFFQQLRRAADRARIARCTTTCCVIHTIRCIIHNFHRYFLPSKFSILLLSSGLFALYCAAFQPLL